MKHKTHNTAQQQGKSLRNILYVWDSISQNQKMGTNKLGESPVEGKKVLTPIKGKGPPGRQRSPGHYPEHPPDGLSWSDGPDDGYPLVRFPKPDKCDPPNSPGSKASPRQFRMNLTIEYQIINNNQKQILLTIKFLLS